MEVQMISTGSSSPIAELTLQGYISQYKGMSRFTRLLRVAETSDVPATQLEAIGLCLQMAKAENMLG